MHWLSASVGRRIAPPFPDPETTWRLRRLIRGFEPDLVHSYGWMTYSCWLAMIGIPTKLIISARDYGMICPLRTLLRDGEICSGPAPGKCLRCSSSEYGVPKGVMSTAGVLGLRQPLARRSAAVHSVSRYTGTRMDEDFLAPAHSSARHAVIHCFAGEEDYELVENDALARLPDVPFILFVGALRVAKGIDVLVAAYASLDDPPPLVLLGSRAPDTPRRFPPGVHVLPATNHATVMAYWDRALFGVLPSRQAEPFGNVVHEAMSRGKAVVGTYPGGHQDMIDSGHNGLLVPAGDATALSAAMKHLLENPDECSRLGIAAREGAARFSSERLAPMYEDLYRAVLAGP
jgi:glycosyltransferase involved in cell wall biosynthesis